MSKKTLPRAQRAQGSGLVWSGLVWSGLCYCNIVFGKGVNLIFPVIALSMCPELWSLHKLNII